MSDIIIEINDAAEYQKILDKKIKKRLSWKEVLYTGVENL
jgi:hypothetical protein